jgi:hypothetical protein
VNYLYFKCEWVVRPLRTNLRGTGGALMSIYSIVTEHDCQLIMDEYTTWKVQDDGCHVIPFMIRVPSNEKLQAVLNALSDYMQFTNLQLVDEKDFVGDPHLFVLSAGATGIMYVLEEMGDHNAKIIKGLAENT